MSDKSKKSFEEWWNECPSKTLSIAFTIVLITFALNRIYEIGYAIGKFIGYIL